LVHGGPSTPGWSTALSVEKKIPTEIPHHFAKKPLCFFEINPRSSFADFALKPLGFSKINPQSIIFQSDPRVQKIITKRSLASEKSTKIAPELQKIISFQPQLQIQ
jgi:hypothetical protein